MNQELYKDRCGFVYAMESDSLPGMLKIGATRLHPLRRADQLSSSTGVPTPFMLVYYRDYDDCFAAEALIHQQLARYRVNQSREFFNVSVNQAIEVFENVVKDVKSAGITSAPFRRTRSATEIETPFANLFASFAPSDDPYLSVDEQRQCKNLFKQQAGNQ